MSRIWWPVALPAALGVPRLRRPLLAAALVPVVIDWSRTVGASPSGRLDPVRYLGLRLLDDAAYGAGVWVGAVARPHRSRRAPALRHPTGRGRPPGRCRGGAQGSGAGSGVDGPASSSTSTSTTMTTTAASSTNPNVSLVATRRIRMPAPTAANWIGRR